MVLTLWAFVVVSAGADGAAERTGVIFVASVLGFFGLPQIIYGLGLGALVALWQARLVRLQWWPPGKLLGDEGRDRRAATWLILVPLLAALVGAAVMGVHLLVTGNFKQVSFQAQGLAASAAGLALLAVLAAPAVYALIEGLWRRLPRPRPMGWTGLVLGGYVAASVVAIGVAYTYAQSLRVWTPAELQLSLGFVVIAPAVLAVFRRWTLARGAWQFGIPLAGAAVIGACVFVAPGWVADDAAARSVVLRQAPLLPTLAGPFVDIDRGDGDIFAYGECEDGQDCGDDDAGPLPVTDADHPARRAVAQAVVRADREQQNEFEAIPDPPKNVVFILIDTLREDHLGYAGYERDTSPNIDAIAAESAVFRNAYATSPQTPRTVPPILFSRYASRIRWYMPTANFPRARPENLSVYEVLAEAGWQNMAMTSHFYFDPRRGLTEGFDPWDNEGAKELKEANTDIATPRVWDKVEPRIEQLGQARRDDGDEAQPFSLLIHFFDPHARYNRHDEFDFGRGETNHERLINAYDSEIAHADHYVGKIVEKLKEEGLYDEVILVITSDHGEEFNEHDYYFHGHTLYNTAIQVPKIVRVPGWYPVEIEEPVSVIDIGPTLLDLLGLSVPADFEGRPLTDALLGRANLERRPIFSELLPYTALDEHQRAVVYGDMKLIVDFNLGLEEFYDLGDDPMEETNLIDSRQEDAAKLRQMLDRFME